MKFLTTKGIIFEIENILKNSKEFIILITPYEKTDEIIFDRLKIAQEKDIDIIFIFREEKNIINDKNNILALQKVNFFCNKRLHAKCYINESMAIITSMNLHEFSENNNYEMGIRIDKNDNPDLYNEILNEANAIRSISKPFHPLQGFCVKCGNQVPFNLKKPLCYNDFMILLTKGYGEEKNPPQNFCINCGTKLENIKNNLCPTCQTIY